MLVTPRGLTKKIAILKTDVFIDPYSKQDQIFNLYHQFFQESGFELNFYDVINNKFPDPAKYDIYLITGSKFSVYDPFEWIINLEDFINNNKLPKLIGICFGHQLIAKARGGKVEYAGWHVGIRPVTFYSSSNNVYNLRFNHHDQVVELPRGAAILAGSPGCAITMFQQGSDTLGMQFHPEYTEKHHKKVIERINNMQGFSPNQYEIFKNEIIGPSDNTKALQVIQTFLEF